MSNNNDRKAIAGLAARLVAASFLTVLVAACATTNSVGRSANPNAKDAPIKIQLELVTVDGEEILCPTDVDDDDAEAWSGKKVIWQTYNENYAAELDYKYDIYFSPMNGTRKQSNNKGYRQITIDLDAPDVTYKYTIWDRAKKCTAHDPQFRVFR